MKRKVIYLLFIILCVFGNVSAQQQSGQAAQPAQEKPQVIYSIPSEVGLTVVAHQPDSPLQFEKAFLTAGSGVREIGAFEARNRGTLPITGYIVAVWTTGNTKSVWTYRSPSRRGWVMPGKLATSNDTLPIKEVVPVPNDLREKMNFNGPMRGLGVFLVVQVSFSDGTSYNDQATFTALQGYMENLSQKMKAQK